MNQEILDIVYEIVRTLGYPEHTAGRERILIALDISDKYFNEIIEALPGGEIPTIILDAGKYFDWARASRPPTSITHPQKIQYVWDLPIPALPEYICPYGFGIAKKILPPYSKHSLSVDELSADNECAKNIAVRWINLNTFEQKLAECTG